MKEGSNSRFVYESFYQGTCRQCDPALSIQSIILLVCAFAFLSQLWPFILLHLYPWHSDLMEEVEYKEGVCSLRHFISKRIVPIGCYSFVTWSDFFGFGLACSLLSELVVLFFGSSHIVGLVLLMSIVQSLLVSQVQYMPQQGGLGVQVGTV